MSSFRVEFWTNKLEGYSSTRPFRDLYMAVAVSLRIISLTVGQIKLSISAIADDKIYFWIQFSPLDFASSLGFAVWAPNQIYRTK